MSQRIFKVTTVFYPGIHKDLVIAVAGPTIKTAADAEAHVLRHVEHMDECGDIHKPVSAIRVRDEPFDLSEVSPKPSALKEAEGIVPAPGK